MCCVKDRSVRKVFRLMILILLMNHWAFSQKLWDGGAGDGQWASAANWVDDVVPTASDNVLLDNSVVALSYAVSFPGSSVTVNSIRITPSSPSVIRLIIPPSNIAIPALTVSGVGGLIIDRGAEFINSSGGSPGTALVITDSIWIKNGGRFVHNSSNGHASYLVKVSRSPGTENGTFEFNVPGPASYTVSMAGRTYGNLELSAFAAGGTKSYLSNGSTAAIIRGDCKINSGVNYSLDFSGDINVRGNLVNAGNFNIASAANNNIIKIGKNISCPGIITETSMGNPVVELSGSDPQNISVTGSLLNSVALRLNNSSGAMLTAPLSLPYKLDLLTGKMTTSTSAMLTLQAACSIQADSNSVNSFINGPVTKLGLSNNSHFLFPVGKGNQQRWIALKNVSGDCTLEFFKSNPLLLATTFGPGIHHVSQIEYWNLRTISPLNVNVELSFDNVNSGGVTDLTSLRVAEFLNTDWTNAGNIAVSGTAGSKGSVVSNNFSMAGSQSVFFTLGSSSESQNPLPIRELYFQIIDEGDRRRFNWIVSSARSDVFYELQFSNDGRIFSNLRKLEALGHSSNNNYSESVFTSKDGFYRIKMSGQTGRICFSNIVRSGRSSGHIDRARLFPTIAVGSTVTLEIESTNPGFQQIYIADFLGRIVRQIKLEIRRGMQQISLPVCDLATGYYRVFGLSSPFLTNPLIFIKP